MNQHMQARPLPMAETGMRRFSLGGKKRPRPSILATNDSEGLGTGTGSSSGRGKLGGLVDSIRRWPTRSRRKRYGRVSVPNQESDTLDRRALRTAPPIDTGTARPNLLQEIPPEQRMTYFQQVFEDRELESELLDFLVHRMDPPRDGVPSPTSARAETRPPSYSGEEMV